MAWEFAFLDFLQGLHTGVTDAFFSVVTHLGDAGLFWIGFAFILLFTKRYRRAGFAMLLAMLMGVAVGNGIIKPLVARVRPYDINVLVDTIVKRPTDFSFPSGHTLASFEASCSLAHYDRKLGAAAIVLACLVAFSRLYLYIHYPTDVLGGFLMALLFSFISCKITDGLKFAWLSPERDK